MAKQLNYNHPNGTNYPESYWRITYLLVDMNKRYAQFVFNGFVNKQARLDGKEPIGVRYIEIRDSLFDFYFQEVTLKTKNPQEVGYEYCMNFKDVIVQETVDGPDGFPIIVETLHSFFENAIDC